MYRKLFDSDLQQSMMNYFIHELSTKGRIKAYEKNQIINPPDAEYIYIVLDGCLNQIITSQDGKEVTLFRLERGTIFGEMDFFDGDRTCFVTRTITAAAISKVPRAIIEEELAKHPDLYKHFIHSIVRKYRIIMLALADISFNDSVGKIANILLRLSYTTLYEKIDIDAEHPIDLTFTHEELASRLNSNRSTITNGLNKLKDKGFIRLDGKYIIITDYEGLKSQTNSYL